MLDFTDAKSVQDDDANNDSNTKTINITYKRSSKPKIVDLEKDNLSFSNSYKIIRKSSNNLNDKDDSRLIIGKNLSENNNIN